MLIAASGLSEATWQADIGILYVGLLAAIVMNIVVFLSSKRFVLAMSLIGYATIVFLLQPWTCFYVFSASDLADPDVADASIRYRQIGILWTVAIITMLGSVCAKVLIRSWRSPQISLANDSTTEHSQ